MVLISHFIRQQCYSSRGAHINIGWMGHRWPYKTANSHQYQTVRYFQEICSFHLLNRELDQLHCLQLFCVLFNWEQYDVPPQRFWSSQGFAKIPTTPFSRMSDIHKLITRQTTQLSICLTYVFGQQFVKHDHSSSNDYKFPSSINTSTPTQVTPQ